MSRIDLTGRAGLLLLVVVFFAAPAGAQTTKWVDQTAGSDANDGNSEAMAYKTLQFAIDNSTDGLNAGSPSIINVKDGTYGIAGQTNTGGFDTAILIDSLDFLTIQAVAGHEPKVKPVTGVEADIVSISVQGCSNLIVDNIDSDQTVAQFDNWHVYSHDVLTVKNSLFEGGEDGIDFNTSLTTAVIENNHFKNVDTGSGDEVLDFTDGTYSDVTIQDNLFTDNYRHITINPPGGNSASDFIIRRNYMDGTNSQEGIRVIGSSDVLIENNCILNSTQQGIYIDSGSSNITIRHNSFLNNGEEQIRTKIDDVVIKNNIIYSNGVSAAISANVDPLANEDYNCIFNEGASTESSQGPVTTFGANTTTGLDPRYVSTTPGSEDLHLKVSSPAIAAGTDLGVTDDNEQSVRPNPPLSDPDKGCFEIGAISIPTLGSSALICLLGLLGLLLFRATLRNDGRARR